MMTAAIQTVAQKVQYQKAQMIARLAAMDPQGARSGWTVRDPYAALVETFEYLRDRGAK